MVGNKYITVTGIGLALALAASRCYRVSGSIQLVEAYFGNCTYETRLCIPSATAGTFSVIFLQSAFSLNQTLCTEQHNEFESKDISILKSSPTNFRRSSIIERKLPF